MTEDKAVEVIRRALASVDKAVGAVSIKPSQHKVAFIVDLMKWGMKFRTSVEEQILMGAEADLMKDSSGSEGDEGLGDLKNQLKQTISKATPATRVDY